MPLKAGYVAGSIHQATMSVHGRSILGDFGHTVQFHTKVNPTLAQGTLVTLARTLKLMKNHTKNHKKYRTNAEKNPLYPGIQGLVTLWSYLVDGTALYSRGISSPGGGLTRIRCFRVVVVVVSCRRPPRQGS